jgi:hypothetical protein
VIGLIVLVFLLVVLGACWFVGEQSLMTKLIFTGLTLLTFGMCLIPIEGFGWFAIAAQALLALVIGGSTFGVGWLSRR